MQNTNTHSVIRLYFQLAIDRNIVTRALRTSLIVGLVLNLISNYHNVISFSLNNISSLTVLLTFIVPYLVSTFSSVASYSSFRPGNVSGIDGILKCKNCKIVDFKASIGEEIEECPNCKKNTKWGLITIFSIVKRENDILKIWHFLQGIILNLSCG
ncbi:MAG TPA: hypothetical protein VMV47_08405 [Bacteroidales bacterium]|nr:hypothetical protein [Bacteroidales bacterium]